MIKMAALGKFKEGWVIAPNADGAGSILENPSDNSNWVIYQSSGGLIIGSHLYTQDTLKPVHLDKILELKPDLYITLVEAKEMEKHGDFVPHISHPSTVVWYPIPDGGIGLDHDIIQIVQGIVEYLRQGKLCYMACWGGHGRSGTIAILVLVAYFGWDVEEAIQINRNLHSSRRRNAHKPTPQGSKQYAQIRRLARQLSKIN